MTQKSDNIPDLEEYQNDIARAEAELEEFEKQEGEMTEAEAGARFAQRKKAAILKLKDAARDAAESAGLIRVLS